MNEKLLQFIWEHQYFNATLLATVDDEPVEVIFPGIFNRDQGPDFLSARLRLGTQEWAGNVELHVNTSHWAAHGHDADPNYNNVILHVVWRHEEQWPARVPVLELQSRVPASLVGRYNMLMGRHQFIPCEKEFAGIAGELQGANMLYGWFEFLASRRMVLRADCIMEKLQANRMDWEETFWQSLARNFGHRVNADAFEQVARTLPLKLMIRHSESIHQLEALLLGQAGLIRSDNHEDYPKMLYREYNFLRRKYGLQKSWTPVHFLRMRPGNFPTVRLAQLAALVHLRRQLFSGLLGIERTKDIFDYFRVAANDYWHYHYRFGEPSPYREKMTGDQLIANIVINTVIPFFHAWGLHTGKTGFRDRSMDRLRETVAETNSIVSGFERLGISARHGGDTQGMLECRKSYCEQSGCLDCAVGKFILRTGPVRPA